MAEKKKHKESFDTKEVEVAPEATPEKEAAPEAAKAEKKDPKTAKAKNASKKDNFFVRTWKKLAKFLKDTKGELKKVTWTPKAEVIKSFKLVIATVVAVGLCIAVVDTVSSVVINTIAGWIG